MPGFLKKATAYTILMGPFVDDTDGKTAETGLTLTQALTRISKNGGDPAQKHEAASATHKENGYYAVTIDGTDTGTVGLLRVMILGSGALPVWSDFCVLDTAVYDWLFGSTAPAVAGDIMKVSSGTGANQISLSSGKAAATIASGDAVGLPAAAAGAKGGLPILDASTGIVLTGYGPAPVTVAKAGDKMDLVDAPNTTAIAAFKTGLAGLGVYLTGIMATALSETSGYLAAAFKKFFNVDTSSAGGTVIGIPTAAPGASGGMPTTNGTKLSQTADLTAGQTIAATVATGQDVDAAAIKVVTDKLADIITTV